MLSSVGLEVMNSTNPELNWKTVTKGRRSRKSIARSLNSAVKVGNNCFSPKRVGDFSGSDSDKFGEVVLGQSTSSKSESVPLKKRRHVLQSPHLCHKKSGFTRARSSSPLSENHEQLQYPSSSGRRSSNWNFRGVNGSAKVGGGDRLLCDQTETEYNVAGDFSGIELLAAAASMDVDHDISGKKDVLENISMPKESDGSGSATLSKVSLKNESGDSSSDLKVHGGNLDCSEQDNSAAASKSTCGSPDDGPMRKVSRHHWDLNTLMDAWDEPLDYSIAGDTPKDVKDDMRFERQESRDNVYSSPGGTRHESSNPKIEVNLTSVSEDRCSEPPNHKEHSQEPPKSIFSNAVATSDRVGEENAADDMNSIQVFSCDTDDLKMLNRVSSSDAVIDSSHFTKLCCTTGIQMAEEKTNSISGPVATMQDEDCSSNVSEPERSIVPDGTHSSGQDIVNSHDMTASISVISIHSRENFELPGNITQEARPILIADSNKQNDGVFVSGSKMANCQGHLEPAEFDDKNEDIDHLNEGLKSCSAGSQNNDPTSSVGKIGFLIDGRRFSDISQVNDVHMVDGDEMTVLPGGYDSPYEDGELRGSFLCSLEENELENECVDYESDGRNGDGSDVAGCPGSEIVEGCSEGSHGTRTSVPLKKVSAEGKIESGPIKHYLRKNSVKDDSDNNEIAGKGSNAGSGTTVEQCLERVMEEDDNMKRRQLNYRRKTVDVKVTDRDEYASKMPLRGKLQSRIEGRSSVDGAAEEKDFYFMQQCRPRRLGGSFSRSERDFSPDRYMGRYGSRSTTNGERDGVHPWTSWGSRKRYALNYQGTDGRYHQTRPRNKNGESVDKIDGADFHDARQPAQYLSKGPHRPLMRRSSPVERDGYFGAGRRIPIARGVGNYRSRGGHYPRHGGRDFVEEFEPPLLDDDDAGPPVRMPRYLSRSDRSFSPGAAARSDTHMALPRRRSRSRSRTRSPRPWPPQRERIFDSRRSPEYRSERMRLPFSKPSFTYDYGDDYMPPTRARFSPQRNCRWVDDRNFADNRRRRSPMRVFRRNQRFDPPGRLKSDDYLRPAVRPMRFSFMGNDGREGKLESSYDERRHGDEGCETMHHHRVLHSTDDCGSVRRFCRQNAGGDGTKTNNEEEHNVVEREGDEVKI